MKKEIIIDGQRIEYTIRKYRRTKNLRLAVNSQGCLVASKPWYLPKRAIADFIIEKGQWVIERLEHFQKINGPQALKNSREGYLANKATAEKLISDKINKFNARYQFKVGRITVRNQRTRWGSCSSRGNLNFNYRLVFLPERMIDYIVVHELCHLREMNHSSSFWKLVAQEIPDYSIIKQDLQKQGIALR
jgi:hypothetical protein